MILPNKYVELKDSIIYKIDIIISEIEVKNYVIEDLFDLLSKKYLITYSEIDISLTFAYAMQLIDIDKEGKLYVESSKN